MKPFAYARPKDLKEVMALLSATARPKGGGYDLLNLAKAGVSTPDTLVDLGQLRATEKGAVHRMDEEPGSPPRIAIQAWATLATVASAPELRTHAPLVAEAAASAATPLVRATATVAGNLLQRPHCAYFRDPFFDCLKRGGKTCPAREGDHAEGAIFDNGKCCAAHPSNLAVALLAADAQLEILTSLDKDGVGFARLPRIADDFFADPEREPLREVRIEPGELLRKTMVPFWPASAYVEVDQKQSFDWASASAAVALRLEGGKVADARVVLGAVAPAPILSIAAWEALSGKVPDEAAATAAAEAAIEGATPLRDNAHKVQHLRVCVKRAVLKAAARGR